MSSVHKVVHFWMEIFEFQPSPVIFANCQFSVQFLKTEAFLHIEWAYAPTEHICLKMRFWLIGVNHSLQSYNKLIILLLLLIRIIPKFVDFISKTDVMIFIEAKNVYTKKLHHLTKFFFIKLIKSSIVRLTKMTK